MYFRNNKTKINIAFIDYKYPMHEDFWDGNWIDTEIKVEYKKEKTEKKDACIRSTDFEDIKKWFTELLERRLISCNELCFIEPCLSFEYICVKNEKILIKINLNVELDISQDFAQQGFQDDFEAMHFLIDNDEIKKIIEEMDQLKTMFIIRGKN